MYQKTKETALKIAKRAHMGQTDKVGADYILHPVAVSGYCVSERGKIAGLLHDVVEDSSVTPEELAAAGIGADIIAAVDCLTKRKGESEDAYFNRIKLNDIAIEVKFSDMLHNSDTSRWPDPMQEKAEENYCKYYNKAQKLIGLTGAEKAKRLMGENVRGWLKDVL